MPTIHFKEITASRTRSGVCSVCKRPRKLTRKFSQTVKGFV